MFVFPTKTLRDAAKFKRITHIIDESLFGGSDYLETIQAGGNEVYGRKVFITQMNPNGSILFNVDMTVHPTFTGELDTTGLVNACWQQIGLASDPYHLFMQPNNSHWNNTLTRLTSEQAAIPRWPNNYAVNINPDVLANLTPFSQTEEPRFVLGGRNLAQWDDYVREWLNRGGRQALTEAARQMNVANFE
jgi:hypothetical protein